MSYYISKFKKVDIKGQGSKNYGASNTVFVTGLKAGVLVFLHDVGKAILAVLLANWLLPEPYVGTIAGCAAVFGHVFPFYLKFDGGKGYAAFLGLAFALYPLFGIIAFLISVVVALLIDYVVASTFSMIMIIPIFALVQGQYIEASMIFITSLLILIKHKDNLRNLITKNGKEASIKQVIFKKKK
jgi:glycerol-3-phosphate acyltransferase PlsY